MKLQKFLKFQQFVKPGSQMLGTYGILIYEISKSEISSSEISYPSQKVKLLKMEKKLQLKDNQTYFYFYITFMLQLLFVCDLRV